MTEEPSPHEYDYYLDFVYAKRVKTADMAIWSGAIHEKHRDFGFSLIVLDLGGGGLSIAAELRKSRQKIEAVDVEVVPIVERDSPVIEGQFILVIFKRDELKCLWPELQHAQGDEMLRDMAHTAFQSAISKASIGLPIPHHHRTKEELLGWPQEKVWASKLLTAFGFQATKVYVETNDDGTWRMVRGARIFGCIGKDDFVDAARNAYIAFRIWLAQNDIAWNVKGNDAALGRSR